MDTNGIQKMPKNAVEFICKTCDFTCSKKSNYTTHILTLKHKNGIHKITNSMLGIEKDLLDLNCSKQMNNITGAPASDNQCDIQEVFNDNKKMPKNANIICLCGNIYKYKSGLYRHKKKCQKMPTNNMVMTINEIEPKPTMLTEEMVMKLITQNNDMQQMMMDQNAKILELVSKSQSQSNVLKVSNKNNKIINNNFNLNVYLNEECKGALNLEDFVSSLEVKLSDLEETAKKGYTEGVSRIFINGLNELDENKRPIHCSDLKREVLYIKNNDEWKKEDPSKKEITNAIKRVSKKNMNKINEWQKKYPCYKDPESKDNDKYLEMLSGVMGGSTDEEQKKNMEKIKRNITKEVVIEKCGIAVEGG
jgi:hypothetical protein